jgi:hypothetical protein
MTTPTFHKFRPKLVGDRVKIPRYPTDESRGYYHGTVVFGRITPFGTVTPGGNTLIVEWDEPVPYLGRYSDTIVAISDASDPDPDPLWDILENWKDAHQFA